MKFEGLDLEFDLDILEPFIQDDDVRSIMVNGTNQIYIMKDEQLVKTDVQFETEERVFQVAKNLVEPMERRVDEQAPLIDARLPDGSRINVVIRPISLTGPTITIQKPPKQVPAWSNLIEWGSIDQKMVDFLEMCVQGKLNIAVVGGSNAGKTTIANLLSAFVDESERIITIETTAELRLRHEHVVTLETRPPDQSGQGEITMDDLFINSVRMLPNRIVTGEVRSGEAWAMIQAMKSGIEGNMFTIHGNSSMDGLERLEGMAMMSGISTPLLTIREQIASAIDVVVNIMQLSDGKRKIMHITEVLGTKNNVIDLRGIFEFAQTGWENDQIVGEFRSTGYIPELVGQLKDANIAIPTGFFDAP